MAISVEKLPYAADALEPHISERTMEIHHEKHYKKYVSMVNQLTSGTPLSKLTLEDLMLSNLDKEGAIFHNAAQAWNHSFYWKCMSPNKARPSVLLAEAIEGDFDSIQKFEQKFLEAGVGLFGSGWVWLVKRPDGKLSIEALRNAGCPLTEGMIPILVCDVWEHAYYLDYENDRAEYLKHFQSIINWKFVEANLVRELPGFHQKQMSKGDLTTASEFEKARESHH